MSIPKNASHEMAGIYYKYGVHQKVFYWSDQLQEWIKSSRTELLYAHSLNNPNRLPYTLEDCKPYLEEKY